MTLKVGNIPINDVAFGEESKIEGTTLVINKGKLLNYIGEDDRLKSLDVQVVKPGESVRIVPVKDVVEPRVKVDSKANIFPGVLGKAETVGEGITHVLKGVSVITTGKIVGFQEGIIDMSGPGADYTPFSKNLNVVIDCTPKDGIKQHEHEEAVRFVGLKAGEYLGKLGEKVSVDDYTEYESLDFISGYEKYKDLPRVAYVYMLQSQGLLHDTYLYGVDVKEILPTIVKPTEVMDGAIISGNCVSACDKNTTYHHLNSPVIYDLYKRHGKDINFVGVIVTNENVTLLDKVRSSNYTAKLVEMLKLDGAVISEEGFGNPDTDLIMNCTKIEKKGVKTVLVTDEYAGRDGASQSLADADKLADAVVTGGNANEVVTLPPMDKIIGYQEVADVIAGGFDGSLNKDGSITVEIQAITGATNELGFNKLSAKGL